MRIDSERGNGVTISRLEQILDDSVRVRLRGQDEIDISVSIEVAESYQAEICTLLEEKGVRIAGDTLVYDQRRTLHETLGLQDMGIIQLAFFLDALSLVCIEAVFDKEGRGLRVLVEGRSTIEEVPVFQRGQSPLSSISLN